METLESLKVLKFDIEEPIVKNTKNGRVTKRKDDSISEIIADEG